jgi:alpha-galactosidase
MKSEIQIRNGLLIIFPLLLVACSSNESKFILTPKPGPEPRINGARIFGVRPGVPFIFKIPAKVERPLKYQVINLPLGLKCDSLTGNITGTISNPGEYLTTLRISNKLGIIQKIVL